MIKNGQVKMELILEDYFKVKNCCLYPVCKFLSTHRLSNKGKNRTFLTASSLLASGSRKANFLFFFTVAKAQKLHNIMQYN